MSADILIKWTSDSSAAVRDIGKVNRALGDTATRSDKTKAALAKAAVVSKVALAALAAGAVYSAKKAIDQQQAYKGLTTVFKGQADVMQQWAGQQAKVGLSATDAAKAASVLGASLQGSGMNARQAADQTQNLVGIATDLGAVFGDTQGATEALGAAMRGEYDPLEKYGIALKQSDVNARLAKKGQDDLTGAALKQAEAIARLELIQEGATTTRGAATDADKTAQQQAEILKASIDNLAASFGEALLPAIQTATEYLQGLADWIIANQGFATNLLVGTTLLAGSIVVLNAIVKTAATLQAAWGAVVAITTSPVFILTAAVVGLAAAYYQIRQAAERATGPMKTILTVIGNGPQYINPVSAGLAVLVAVMQRVRDAATTAARFVANLWQSFTGSSVLSAVSGAIGSVAGALSRLLGAIGAVLSAWNSLKNTILGGLPSIPGLSAAPAYAAGLTRTPGSTTATRAPGSVIININGFSGNEDLLARRVVGAMNGAGIRYNRTRLAR